VVLGFGGFVGVAGGSPDPSLKRTTWGLGGFVEVGGSPDPSAKATEASDIINTATARTRFILISFNGGFPRETV
jgi:hypothetical protein